MDCSAIIGRSARPPDDTNHLQRWALARETSGGATKIFGSSKTQVLRWRSRPGKVERLPRNGLLQGSTASVCGCSLRTQQGAR